MGKFKDFKTAIRKKIGWVGVGEFVNDPIQANSKNNWNNWFSNSKFLAEYADPKRLDTLKKMTNILRDNNVFESVQSCIDCGCGTGHLLLEINKQYPDIKLTGSDFSEESIKVSQKIVPNATFFVADVYKEQPEIAEKFDLVICSEVLEHLLYPEKALQNILKAASPKGKIVLAVPNGRIDNYSGHIIFWSLESWKVFIEKNVDTTIVSLRFFLFNNGRNNIVIIEKIH